MITESQIALAVSSLSLATAFGTFLLGEWREHRIEKSNAYFNLEIQSTAWFKSDAESTPLIKALISPERPARLAPEEELKEARDAALNLYLHALNLFEVCARFRRLGIVERQVFASWVAWFHTLVSQWYFRALWHSKLRENYTRDVRAIFDVGCEIMESSLSEIDKRDAFYDAVADIMGGCSAIREWNRELARPTLWEKLKSAPKYRSPGTSPSMPPAGQPPSAPASSVPSAPI